MKEWSKSDKLA